MDITREYLDKQFKLTKEYIDKRLVDQFELTKEYVGQQMQKLVTKEDFNRQLERLVTKEDLGIQLKILREDIKGDIDIAINDLSDNIIENVVTPLNDHIAKVKTILKLPGEEKTQPILVQDGLGAHDPAYPSLFAQRYIEDSTKLWKKWKIPEAKQREYIKRILRPRGKPYRRTKPNSGR